MKFTYILALATLVLGVAATPVGNADVSNDDRPVSLSRESIPAGAPVFGLSENPASTGADDGDGSSPIRMSKRDDCHGSGLCGQTSGGSCTAASNAYNSNGWYCGYTSRVSTHCTAIFTCGNYHGTCWAGWFLKQQFTEIYTVVGCRICGSRYFDNGNCRVTYNYCGTCRNVG